MNIVSRCGVYELICTFMLGGLLAGAPAPAASTESAEAANCICLAAAPDAPSSLNHLGISYAKGAQGKRNPRLAMRFFLRSAMQGYTPAMANLGTLYQMGALGRPNFPRAYAWVRAALSFGVPEQDHDATVMKLGMIAARLGPEQINGAERLAGTLATRIVDTCTCSPGRETE